MSWSLQLYGSQLLNVLVSAAICLGLCSSLGLCCYMSWSLQLYGPGSQLLYSCSQHLHGSVFQLLYSWSKHVNDSVYKTLIFGGHFILAPLTVKMKKAKIN